MEIVKADKNDIELIAMLVRESNRDVAIRFELDIENNPKHPSFYTADWAKSDFERGEEYFVALKNGQAMGCVAYASPEETLSYLNRLSVLPKYRRRGVGAKLVKKVIDYSKQKGKKSVSIGIIAKYSELKDWYIKLDFVEGETRSFQHLPFDVMYLSYKIDC